MGAVGKAMGPRRAGRGRVTVLFLSLVALLSVPAMVGYLWGDRSVLEDRENRHMAHPPRTSLLWSRPTTYLLQLDLFIKDRIGGRLAANEVYSRLKYYVFHDAPLANITIGRDGFTFMNSHDIFRPNLVYQSLCVDQVEPEQALVDEVHGFLDRFHRFHAGQGRRVTIVVAPTKPGLYPDKLPPRVDKRYRDGCAAYGGSRNLLARLRERAAREGSYDLFYPSALFREHRDEPYFYPRERFHWSGASAHLAVRHLLWHVKATEGLILDNSSGTGLVEDDMGRFFGFDRSITARVYDYERFETTVSDVSLKALGVAAPLKRYRSRQPLSERRALLLSNSFGIDFVDHLAVGYRELDYLNLNSLRPSEEGKLFAGIAAQSNPDDVFLLFDDAGITAVPMRLRAVPRLDRHAKN